MKRLASLSLLIGLAGAVLPSLTFAALPSFAEVRSAYRPSDAWLLDRDGREIAVQRIDKRARRLPWVPLKDVAPALSRAVLLAEDRRFRQHAGVDWQAAAASAWGNLWRENTRGASTLTMQLAGLIDQDARRRGRRDLLQKIDQAALALRLERDWSKDQILEAYLNLVAFRGELEGVAAMSRGLFGKWPEGLDERESALAAALLRAPGATPKRVADRACLILREMQRDRFCDGLDSLAKATLGNILRRADDTPGLAPHLARKLLSQPGQRLRSSLDGGLQRFAADVLRRHLGALGRRNVSDGAVIAIDNASGEILAWVGSSGELSEAAEVDGVIGPRQAGSTLKPFLYALALERRHLTAASLIEDAPFALPTGNGLYAPQNYEPDFHGWVSARMALGGSLNVPAVKTLVRVGVDDFHRRLRELGFDTLTESGEWYGYSLALGSADVSLLALANAYRTLANGGRWSPLRATPGKSAIVLPGCPAATCRGAFGGRTRQVVPAGAAYIVGHILADPSARAGTFGLESWLATPYWSAAKTGTSKDMRDNWCAGWSRRYTVAVWVGNAGGESMHEVYGISGAAPVWREVMDRLHRGADGGAPVMSGAPPAPRGIVRGRVRFAPETEPTREEWFIAGTERSLVRAVASRSNAGGIVRIRYPADGSVIALDPDIPPRRQRLRLALASPGARDWRWQVDGRTIARADRDAKWLPQPGRHKLHVIAGDGGEIDAVTVNVRALAATR